MVLLAASILAASFFLAVAVRGWPPYTATFGPATGGDDAAEAEVVSTHAIGFALPAPEEDEWDEGPAAPGGRRGVGFRR